MGTRRIVGEGLWSVGGGVLGWAKCRREKVKGKCISVTSIDLCIPTVLPIE